MQTSENTKELISALVKAKSELANPPKSADNPFFKSKYAPLDAVLDHVRPILSKHGLAVMFDPVTTETQAGAAIWLTHESGEWALFNPVMVPPTKKDPQGVGAAMTYAERYALCASLGISGDPDDDGNKASGVGDGKKQEKNGAQNPPPKKDEKPPHPKAVKLNEAAKGNRGLVIEALGAWGYEKAAEVPDDVFPQLIADIQMKAS